MASPSLLEVPNIMPTRWFFCKVRSILFGPASTPTFSLGLADFTLDVTAMPFGAATNVSRSWHLGNSACSWYALAHAFVSLCSILHQTVTAIKGWPRSLRVVWRIVISSGSLPPLGCKREGSGAVCWIKWKFAHFCVVRVCPSYCNFDLLCSHERWHKRDKMNDDQMHN